MKYRHRLLIVISAILVIGSELAFGGALRTSRGRAMPQASHGTAFAALQPVGAATGWGRVVVRDDDLPSGPKRTIQVWLFGMEKHTEYLVTIKGVDTINGVDIGVVLTRSSGNGVLKLQNDGRGHEPVPEELPPAEDLDEIVVYGPGMTPTLEGSFSILSHPGGETTYEEEIELEDVSGGEAEGMAKVEMKEGGHQEFKTCATGLIPFETYTVVVNGVTVATVRANEQGQACVKLEEPDDDDPLPSELLPVSKIEMVEWKDSNGDRILFGEFTGVGTCAQLTGIVTGFNADGFILETADETVDVVVTDDTEWDDFGDHELAIGDKVKVRGCWREDDLVAEEIKLLNDGSCAKFVGVITDVSGENFVLDTDEGPIQVVTTPETVWIDFGDHELAVGDKVKVDGCWNLDVFVAEEVELKNGNGGDDDCATLVGLVSEAHDGGFTMDTEAGPVTVVTTPETEWEDFDVGIAVGDRVKVDGCWEGDVFVAYEVELKNPDDSGNQCKKITGVVTEVVVGDFTMTAGNKSIPVTTNEHTEWVGFDGPGIAVGDKVKVDGCWDGEVFVAKEVELKKRA